MTTVRNHSATSRWRLRAAATAVAGVAGFALVGGGTAFAAPAPPPPKPAPAPKPAPTPPTNNKPTPPPPAPKPTKNPQDKARAQGYLKQAQQDEQNIHQYGGQATKLVGQANAAWHHAQNAAKKADDQLAKVTKAMQGVTFGPDADSLIQQVVAADRGANQAATAAGAAAGLASNGADQIVQNDSTAKSTIQQINQDVAVADTQPSAADEAGTLQQSTSTLSTTSSSLLANTVQYQTDQANFYASSADTYQQTTQQVTPQAVKLLAGYQKTPYVAPPTTTGSGGDTTGTQTGGNGGTQTGGGSTQGNGGGTQTGNGGGTQGNGGGTQTGNGGGVPRQPVPVVTVVQPGAGTPATTGTTVAGRQPASTFVWQLPAQTSSNPATGTTNVLGQQLHRSTGKPAAKPGRMPLGVGRQHVGTGLPGILHMPASIRGLGWIPLLAILLLVEVLILSRRFVTKARARRAHRTGAPAVATAKAAALVPAPAKRPQPALRLRRVMAWRHSGRPIWKPALPSIGSSGRAGPQRL